MKQVAKYNYYDVLKRKQPELFSFVEKEIAHVKASDLSGPFGSTDEYSKYFKEYFDSIVDSVLREQQSILKEDGHNYSIEGLRNELLRTSLFESLGIACNADYLTMTNFELFGKKTFYFADALVEHLALTSLDISSEFIELPFPCSLFVMTSPLVVDALDRIRRDDEGELSYNAPVSTFLTSRPCEEGHHKIIFATWQASYSTSPVFVKRELLIREGWGIEDMLRTDWRDVYDDLGPGETVDESRFFEEGLLFYRILLNAVLYLGSNEPDILTVLSVSREEKMREVKAKTKSHAKRKKAKKELLSKTALNSALVGSNIAPIVVDKSQLRATGSGESHNLKKIDKRFIVRGHWKRQAYGTQRSMRKLIFIKPYFKGPDVGELVQRRYEVR